MMMAAAMLPRKGRRWGDRDHDDSEEEVVEVRWTTMTRPSRRREVAAGERVKSGNRRFWGWHELFFVTFFWLLFFLAYVEPNFFSIWRRKILQCSPYISRVSGGGGERKYEVRDGMCPGIQNPKSTGIEAVCN